MFGSLKRRYAQKERAEALYWACVEQARSPEFYAELGIPDTVEGRFELISLHVGLLIRRLNAEGETGKAVAQDVFDAMFRELDSALREMAVGDMSVGKQIKAMGEAFYGRMKAYDAGLSAGDARQLDAPFARNLLAENSCESDARPLSDYALASQAALAEQSGETLMFTGLPQFAVIPVRAGA
ncbi:MULTISPECIES: ubiquinol-cytochrome C chaperone family protein [Hyphobacterium]|uniref:Ubiquinol-cytochrome C chaperone family protein n=1 Tax=Hyphobacterium vulgare TaxID=1736751 RepID=A0ABV6ZTD0_9PROT